MTFPSVAAVNGGNSTSDITNPTINLPDGSNVAGQRILIHVCSDGSGETLSLPAGWNKILTDGGSGFTNALFYRDTDGTEGYPATGATITATITSVEQSAHTSYRITGFDTATAPAVSSGATGTSTGPNADALNPSGWDVEDTLWLTFCAMNGLSSTTPRLSGYPSGYSGGRSDVSAGGNGVIVGAAYKESAAASEDPGAFTAPGPNVTKSGTGIYYVDFTITQEGMHQYRIVGTGTLPQATQGAFMVLPVNV